ncbi:MAG: L,D-transpeptidase family protein [Thermodesulfobacteriota bacterium]|nr:L,D-transpeptidase family protein [Thermodesulfobacteriota bacterium]
MVPQKLKHLIATAFTLLFSFLFVFHSHATTQAIQKQQDIPDCLIALSSGHAVVVDKGAQKFFVYHNGDNGLFNKVYESECSTGKNQGAKMVEGDGKTPEGIFFPTKLFAKNQLSSTYGSMAFHIDYPNLLDRKTGRDGNNIWIHGTNKPLCPFQSNGCITLTNKSIKRLFNYINLNKTPIIIEKSIKWIPQDARLDIKKSLEHLLDSWIKASNISFSMQAVDVSILRHGRSAVILFDQILSVNNISRHSGYKKLFLKENQGRWLIVGDEFQPPAAEKLFASTLSTLNRTAMDHEAIKKLIERWAKSWESGNMENYRSCYSPDFSARRMNLSNWISYKTELKKRNKNIRICIEDIKISSGEERGLAVFTQEYNSSNYNATGTKKLRFKKAGGEWKIYRETWTAKKDTYHGRTAMNHEAIKKLIERWAKSWESGNVENYRSCYSPDFSARRMNLSNWISYKTKLRKRNKNIRICIEDIKISSGEERGLAVFTQEYNSSNYNATGIKKLRFKKIDGEWKIYRETWTARKE